MKAKRSLSCGSGPEREVPSICTFFLNLPGCVRGPVSIPIRSHKGLGK